VSARTCLRCGQDVENEPGVGLVTVASGDDGGTYDVCPEAPEHDPGHAAAPADKPAPGTIGGTASVKIEIHLDADKRYDVRWASETVYREVRLVIVNAADGTAAEYGAKRTKAGVVAMNAQHRSLHWGELPKAVRDMAREALSLVLERGAVAGS
jgi:hypothetical protein